MTTPNNQTPTPRKTNWPMIILIVLVGFIALQMFNAEQEENEMQERQDSLTCFLNQNPIYCG